MNKTSTSLIIALLAVAGAAFAVYRSTIPADQPATETASAASAAGATSTATATVTGTASSTLVKLADEPYAASAYRIDPAKLGALDAAMQEILSGFVVTAQHNADGTITITLKATKAGYKDQQYTLVAGQSLYFIEKNLHDDTETGATDKTYMDDSAVVVDQNGYVVQ